MDKQIAGDITGHDAMSKVANVGMHLHRQELTMESYCSRVNS